MFLKKKIIANMALSELRKELKSLVVKDMGKALDKFEEILNSNANLYNDVKCKTRP